MKFNLFIVISFMLAVFVISYPRKIAPMLDPIATPAADTAQEGQVAKAERARGYVACGCGCCGSAQPRKVCVSAEELQTKIAEDKLMAAAPDCAYRGCEPGVNYQLCD